MIRTEKRLKVCAALLIANLLLIWGNSLLPGTVSQAISDWVKEVLGAILAMAQTGEETGFLSGSWLIRKTGHFLEFTALGMCLAWMFGMLHKEKWVPLAFGAGAAWADETIQRFVPGRSSQWSDVALDCCGVVFGMLLLNLGHRYIGYRIRKGKKT